MEDGLYIGAAEIDCGDGRSKMSEQMLDSKQLCQAFRFIAEAMKARSDDLRELDAACGDGDLGVTVTKGFTAIEKQLGKLEGEPPGRLLKTLGMTFNNAAASTFGVFFATACMYASKSIEKKDHISVEDLCTMLKGAVEGIEVRGRAKIGDKTILDALIPAQQAAEQAVKNGQVWPGALAAATAAAKKGAEDTRGLVPKAGRARWLGEQVQEAQDPGATFVYLFLDACQHAFQNVSEVGGSV